MWNDPAHILCKYTARFICSYIIYGCKQQGCIVVVEILWPTNTKYLFCPLFRLPNSGIFPTQGSNSGLPHCRWILYQLSHKGSPRILGYVTYPFSWGSSWPRNQIRVFCTEGKFFPAELPGKPMVRPKYRGQSSILFPLLLIPAKWQIKSLQLTLCFVAKSLELLLM